MEHKLVFMLKTYSNDVLYAQRLISSYQKHNANLIPMFIVVPEVDVELFEKFKDKNIQIIAEESVTDFLVKDDSVRGIRPGYINQEIIKLAFWELGLCENYLCLDSDAEFIRDFYFSDFMYDENTPFSILVEDNELAVDPEYYNEHWIGRSKLLEVIKKELELEDPRTLTCHNMTIFSAKVLKAFKEKYLLPRGYTYIDLLKKSPYEFSWYNFWLQKDITIPIVFREPLFKMFHTKNQHLEYIRKKITIKDIARGYLGVVVNSNYSRGFGVVGYDQEKLYKVNILKRVLKKLKKYLGLIFP